MKTVYEMKFSYKFHRYCYRSFIKYCVIWKILEYILFIILSTPLIRTMRSYQIIIKMLTKVCI